MLSFLLNQIWIGIDDILFNFFATFRISFGTAGYCIDKSFSNLFRLFIVFI